MAETEADSPPETAPETESIIVVQPPSGLSLTAPPSDAGEDAPRKQKRRSGNSVDLTYRYCEPSDDELSWAEDGHGTRRRRKSKKRKSGAGDDFRTGIMCVLHVGI